MAVETFKKAPLISSSKAGCPTWPLLCNELCNWWRSGARRKEAEHALQKSGNDTGQLVELCPDALLVQSDDHIVFANTAAARLLGADSVEQLIGKPLKEIIRPDYWR